MAGVRSLGALSRITAKRYNVLSGKIVLKCVELITKSTVFQRFSHVLETRRVSTGDAANLAG